MKVSKVVLIVVALHVVVIGGIFVFEGCSRSKNQPSTVASDESVPGQATGDQAAVVATNLPETTTMPGPTPAVTSTTPTVTEPIAAPAATTYIVKKGETLRKISKAQGVGMTELCKANNVAKTAQLRTGQKLTIPAKATAVASATTTAPAAIPAAAMTPTTATATTTTEAAGTLYAVKSGDSLWKIANKNGTTVAALKKANNLTSDTLKVGQKLHLPVAATTASGAAAAIGASPVVNAGTADFRDPGTYKENGQTLHVVDAGESPALIAKKYGVKVQDLMKANNITDPKQIHYGQKLVIPVAQAAPVVTAAAGTGSAAPVAPTATSPLVKGPVTIN